MLTVKYPFRLSKLVGSISTVVVEKQLLIFAVLNRTVEKVDSMGLVNVVELS
jgi:hypothetical protein